MSDLNSQTRHSEPLAHHSFVSVASMSRAGHSRATIDIHSTDDGVGLRRIRHEARYGNDGGTRPPPILHAVRAMRRHVAGPRMVRARERTLRAALLVVRHLRLSVREHGLPFAVMTALPRRNFSAKLSGRVRRR